MLELRKLSVGDGKDVYQMLQDIPLEENGLQNNVNGLTYEAYQDWLVKKQQESELDGIVDGWKVPATTYWLYADGVPVGFGKLRHFLTDALRKAGGHIGYGIAPQYRGKGYGKEAFLYLVKRIEEEYNPCTIYFNAQYQLFDYYKALGFTEEGETFYEANIKHIKMVKKA